MIGLENIQKLKFDNTIHPDDGMFAGNFAQYENIGKSALVTIDMAMRMTNKSVTDIGDILDFACGYGRVLRALRTSFPHSSITACDFDKKATDFCANQFDAVPIISSNDVSKIEISGQFDIIWVGSFFTHLPLESFDSFIDLFVRLLKPKGLLIFTTAGRDVARRIRSGELGVLKPRESEVLLTHYESLGFGWVGYPSYDWYWGRALIKPSWVLRKLEKQPILEVIYLRERYWANRQDTVCCQATKE